MSNETLSKRVIAIVPALNPTDALTDYCAALLRAGMQRVVVVNDGSVRECEPIFAKLSLNTRIDVLRHDVNMGKGAALKTAFTYILASHLSDDIDGVVTADADGQHLCGDVVRTANELERESRTIILGVRDFDASGVPKRNRFGNKISAAVYQLLYCQKVDDTQTGLRALPVCLLSWAASIEGERFEYEMRMLTSLTKAKIKAKCVPITVVYDPENYSTHFNPLKDSYRIMKILFCEISARPALSFMGFFVELLLLALGQYIFPAALPRAVAPAIGVVCAVSLRYLLVEMLAKSISPAYEQQMSPYTTELLFSMASLIVCLLLSIEKIWLTVLVYALSRTVLCLLWHRHRLKKDNS